MLIYKDDGVIVETQSDGYGKNQTIIDQQSVKGILLQRTNVTRNNVVEVAQSNAVFYVDPANSFIIEQYYRLEGLYLVVSLYGAPNAIAWFKIIDININRDHLLTNTVDNIELVLEKTVALGNVS